MKYFILAVVALFVFKDALADCRVKEASQMIQEVETGPVLNLVKTVKGDSCQVSYSILVNGVEHKVNSAHKDCAEAIERGKNELLVTLAGKYRIEVVTTCKEGGELFDKPVKVGEVVMENELLRTERQTGYFKYNNSKCRLFKERYVQNNKLRVNHGVICQINENDWIVVDKW
jgi:hypothetical protein